MGARCWRRLRSDDCSRGGRPASAWSAFCCRQPSAVRSRTSRSSWPAACRSTSISRSARTLSRPRSSWPAFARSSRPKCFSRKPASPPIPSMIFLEDLIGEITIDDKIAAFFDARLSPSRCLPRDTALAAMRRTRSPRFLFERQHRHAERRDADARQHPREYRLVRAGLPDGHGRPSSRRPALLSLVRLHVHAVVSASPGFGVVFHPNPMDAKTVGELAGDTTPRCCFADAHVLRELRRGSCTPNSSRRCSTAIVGAEKLREPLRSEFREKFGIPLFEGYGMTEMSPVVAVNRPDFIDGDGKQTGNKPGSVGRPMPGRRARRSWIPDTGAPLPSGAEGLLLREGSEHDGRAISNDPERTAEVIRDGWYVTGDIAHDRRGRLHLHHGSADAIQQDRRRNGSASARRRRDQRDRSATSRPPSRPCPTRRKGERLVAFYTRGDLSPEGVERATGIGSAEALDPETREHPSHRRAAGARNGKTDLRGLKALAMSAQNDDL